MKPKASSIKLFVWIVGILLWFLSGNPLKSANPAAISGVVSSQEENQMEGGSGKRQERGQSHHRDGSKRQSGVAMLSRQTGSRPAITISRYGPRGMTWRIRVW